MIESTVVYLQHLVHAHQGLAIVTIGLISFAESLAIIAVFFPFFSAMLALGALLGNDREALAQAWLACSAGAALGYWLSYATAYHFSERIDQIVKSSKYRAGIEHAEVLFRTYGVWAVLFGRFSKPIRTTITVVAGMTRMPGWQFQAANLVSAVTWSAFVLFSGAILAFMQQLWHH